MKKLLLISSLFFVSNILVAQEHVSIDYTAKRNILKLNVFAFALKNGSLQYEKILSRKISIGLGGRFMPASKTPYIKMVTDEVAIQNAKISNFALTPELRFYLGSKGYGEGFYIGPYYRYANFDVSDIKYDFSTNGVTETVWGKGSVQSHSGGILLGSQWLLGRKKNIVLDWTILGAHYGVSKGNVDAVYNGTLTDQEQQDLKKKIDETDIRFIKKTSTVSANGANIKIDGPWAGLRSSLSIGIKF